MPLTTASPRPDTGQHVARERRRPSDRRKCRNEVGDRRLWLRRQPHQGALREQGTFPVTSGRSKHKRPIQYDE